MEHTGRGAVRAGHWDEAIAALQKSMDLRNGGMSADWFFLAMAHLQLGHKEEARTWYDKAVEWMDKNQPQDGDLRGFRDEAAALLGVAAEAKGADEAKPATETKSVEEMNQDE